MLQNLFNTILNSRKKLLLKQVVCIVYGDQVFLPVNGKTRNGVFLYMDTTFKSPIDIEAIAANINKAEALGNPILSNDYKEIINAAIVKAIGSKVESRWVKRGAMVCILGWFKAEITLAFNQLKPTEPGGIDFANALHYPVETPTQVLAEAIITEWRRRNQQSE